MRPAVRNLLFGGKRKDLQIAVVSWTGNGVDNRNIYVGFKPDMVFVIKHNTTLGYIKVLTDVTDLSKSVGDGSNATVDKIQFMVEGGFQVGTGTEVNANGQVFSALCIKSNLLGRGIAQGAYSGNGGTQTITNLFAKFIPILAAVISTNSNITPMFRFSNLSNNYDLAVASVNTGITGLVAGGMTLNSNVAANGVGNTYDYLFLENIPAAIKIGTFIGTGSQKSITGLGFRPDWVMCFNTTTGGLGCLIRTDYMAANASNYTRSVLGGAVTDGILQSDPDGFTVGTRSVVNAAGATIEYIAFKAGNFKV